MVWVTFLGGAAASRRGVHMTITEFLDKLRRPRARRIADARDPAGPLASSACWSGTGIGIVNASWGNELTVLHVPMAIQYLALPVGAASMAVFVAWDLVADRPRPLPRGALRRSVMPDPVPRRSPSSSPSRCAGVPLMFALLATTVGVIWANGLTHPLETIFLSFIGGVEPFILIAVPLFIFAGELLSQRRRGQAHRRASRARCSASCRAGWASSPSRRA